MLIKQFTGTTIDEILPQIREELGDDALILATRRVTKGGLGGFFGRETLEVTAAQGGSHEEIAEVNREAADRPGADLLDDDRAPFSRHLQGRLAAALEAEGGLDLLADDSTFDRPAAGGAPAASPAGAYSRGMDTPLSRPFALGDQQRTQAIIDAARQAMRQAAAQSSATGATAMAADDIAGAAAAEARTRVQPPPWATSAPLAREDVVHAIADAGNIRRPAMPVPSAVRPTTMESAPVTPIASPEAQRQSWAPLSETAAATTVPAPAVPAAPATSAAPAAPAPAAEAAMPAPVAAAPVPAAMATEPAPAPVVAEPAPVVAEPAPVIEGPAAGIEEEAVTIPAPGLGPLVLLTDPRPPAGEHPAIRAARADLADAGVHERYLEPLIDAFSTAALPFADERVDVRGLLRDWISARLPVVRDWKPRASGHAIVLVGQSGVGKTTTACKLAGRMSAAGLRVALIAAGRGSHQTLEGHARRLGIDAVLAEDAEALRQAREALSDRDIIIVDTAGRSHQDLAGIEDLTALIGPCKPDEVHLVLPVTAALADLGDVTRRFRIAGVNRVSVTKLDETKYHGNLVNFPLRVGKPLGFIGDGTTVPSALRPADARAIAEMLLP